MSIESKIESLLFLSGRPMSVREISELIKEEAKAIEEAGEKLIQAYKEKNSGIQLIKNGASFQMVTSPENAALAQEFVKDETTGELSRPSLETLTIIAYRGPVSKTDLDRIRGINCSLILRNLLQRGLIDSRDDKKTEEHYYAVTFDFLRFLGLNKVEELPDYERLSKDDTIDRILEDNPLKEGVASVAPIVEAINQETAEVVAEIEAAEEEIEEIKAAEEELDGVDEVTGVVVEDEEEDAEDEFDDDEEDEDDEGDEEDEEEAKS